MSIPANATNPPLQSSPVNGMGFREWKKMTGADREAAIKCLPASILESGNFEGAVALLTDLEFLEAKVAAGLIAELITDLETAFERAPEGIAGREFLFLIARFLRFDLEFLSEHPDRFFQCAWNRCWWHDNPEAENHYQAPRDGWTADNAPWKRPGDKLYVLMEQWRKTFESREKGSWLRAMTPPAIPLGGRLAVSFDFRKRRGVSFLCAHQSAGRVVALDGGGAVSVWDMDRSAVVESFNEDDVSSGEFDLGGDDDYEVLGYIKKDYRDRLTRILLWSPGRGYRIYRYDSPAVFLSKRLGRLFSSQENKIYSLDLATGDNNFLCEMHDENKFIYCMAVDEENGRIITGANDDRLCGYDFNACEKYFETPFASSLSQIIPCPGTDDLITIHDDRSFYLWNARFGRMVREFAGHRKFVTGAVFDRARGRILSSSNDGTVREWSLAACSEGGAGRTVITGAGAFQNVALIERSRKIITVSEYSAIGIWFDMPSGAPEGPVLKKRAAIKAVERSGDGKYYFTHHADDTLVLWNAETGAADGEIAAPASGPIVRIIPRGTDSLVIAGFDKAGVRSITLVDTSGRSIIFSRRFDEKFSGCVFDDERDAFYIIHEECLCLLDLASNKLEELFKLEHRAPNGEIKKIVPVEPSGKDGSKFSNFMYFEVPADFIGGYSDKLFIYDTLEKKVAFEYCRPGHVMVEKTIISSHEILYFYTVKHPELKLLEKPSGVQHDESAPPEVDVARFLDDIDDRAREFEFNFIRLADYKVARFPFHGHWKQSFLESGDLLIVLCCVDPLKYQPVEGETFEMVLFDLARLSEHMRLSLPAPIVDYNIDCPGRLLITLADGSVGVLPMADCLKLTITKVFDDYISEIMYISKNLFMLTDSGGSRRLFDARKMSVDDCAGYMVGAANVIFENDRGALEMLSGEQGYFLRLKLTDQRGLEEDCSGQAVPGNVTDAAFIGGRYYCVLDERLLYVSDEAGNRLETLDLMNTLISAAGEDEIASTGAAQTLFSGSGSYMMYLLNYRLKTGGRPDRQAILLYDAERGAYEVKRGISLDGGGAPGIWKPFHISPEKRIYFMRTRPDDKNDGGFFIYDFERGGVSELDLNFLFGCDFTALASDARGLYIAAARPYGQVLVADLREGGNNFNEVWLDEHYYPITSLYFTRDGRYLITRSFDGLVIRWKTGSWEKVDTVFEPFPIFEFKLKHEDDPRRHNVPRRDENANYLCFAANGDEGLYYNMRPCLDPDEMDYIDRPGDGGLIVIGDKDKLHFIKVESGGLHDD